MKFTNNWGAIIRFPLPGAIMLPEEKIRNEASIMRFILETTSSDKLPVPVPPISRWTEKERESLKLGSFHHKGVY